MNELVASGVAALLALLLFLAGLWLQAALSHGSIQAWFAVTWGLVALASGAGLREILRRQEKHP